MSRELAELFAAVDFLFQESLRPFPSVDCKKAADLVGISYRDLKPDLDLYFSEIAGYCSWGRRIQKWPPSKMADVRRKLKLSFFERYPQYLCLANAITEAELPDLFRVVALHEDMRMSLAEILDQLATGNLA